MAEALDVRLTLVSGSPRRAELLRRLNVPFDIFPSAAAEHWSGASAAGLAVANARRKVERSSFREDRSRLLLGADTMILAGGRLLGKPAGPESARKMLELLSGRQHAVITGVCFAGPDVDSESGVIRIGDAATTVVRFRELSSKQIDNYIRSGEWQGKAGAYAIQALAGEFVECLDGDYDNVVGLPLKLIRDLIREKFIHCRLR